MSELNRKRTKCAREVFRFCQLLLIYCPEIVDRIKEMAQPEKKNWQSAMRGALLAASGQTYRSGARLVGITQWKLKRHLSYCFSTDSVHWGLRNLLIAEYPDAIRHLVGEVGLKAWPFFVFEVTGPISYPKFLSILQLMSCHPEVAKIMASGMDSMQEEAQALADQLFKTQSNIGFAMAYLRRSANPAFITRAVTPRGDESIDQAVERVQGRSNISRMQEEKEALRAVPIEEAFKDDTLEALKVAGVQTVGAVMDLGDAEIARISGYNLDIAGKLLGARSLE